MCWADIIDCFLCHSSVFKTEWFSALTGFVEISKLKLNWNRIAHFMLIIHAVNSSRTINSWLIIYYFSFTWQSCCIFIEFINNNSIKAANNQVNVCWKHLRQLMCFFKTDSSLTAKIVCDLIFHDEIFLSLI